MNVRIALAGALCLVLGPGVCVAQQGGGTDAVLAVRATLEVEETLLQEDTRRYQRLSARRARALDRLGELYRALDVAVGRTDGAAPEAIVQIMEQIEDAERERAALLASAHVLVDRISSRVRRISLLEERVDELEQRVEESAGALSGSWNVTLLPVNQRGRFNITQTGTMLSGTYTLEGGWSGSLQGTLVNRKIYLVRIDSKLGRTMEFEGQLSSNGDQIRGSWLNYELSGLQGGSTGQWSAVRRAAP